MAELAQGQLIDWVYQQIGVINAGSHTVRFTFNSGGGDCRIGKFYDGSYWICPVTPGASITITGAALQGSTAHLFDGGLMRNPTSILEQGVLSTQTTSGGSVTPYLYNAAVNLMGSLPITITAADGDVSLVKAVMDDNDPIGRGGSPSTNYGIDFYLVLTVLREPPADGVGGSNTLRPAMIGTNKTQHLLSEFDLTKFPSDAAMQTALGTVTQSLFDNVATRWNTAWPDLWMTDDKGNAFTPSCFSQSSYSANVANDYLDGLMLCCGTASAGQKAPAIYALLQRGLDIYYAYQTGKRWPGGAGQGHGRYIPYMLFGHLITNSTIKSTIKASDTSNFQENSQLGWLGYEHGGSNAVVWGDGDFASLSAENPSVSGSSIRSYWGEIFASKYWAGSPYPSSPTVSNTSQRDPYGWVDAGAIPGCDYMACCSTSVFIANSVVLNLISGFMAYAGTKKLYEFSARYVDSGPRYSPDIVAPPSPLEPSNCNVYSSPYTTVNYGTAWGDDLNSPRRPVRISGAQTGRFTAGEGNVSTLNRKSSYAFAYITNNSSSVLKAKKPEALPVGSIAFAIIPAAQLAVANAVMKALDFDTGGSGSFRRGASASGNAPATHYVSRITGDARNTATGVAAIMSDALMLKTVVNDAYAKRSLGTVPLDADMDALVATFTGGTSKIVTTGTMSKLLSDNGLKLI